jgi:predicted PurR-regulated permease PerM
MNPDPSTQWRSETKVLVSIGLAIFALFVVYLMRPVLPMLVMAALIAYVASPSIRFLNRRLRVPNGASVAITYLLASILVVILLFVLLPQAVRAANVVVQVDRAASIDAVRSWAEITLIRMRDNDLGILGVRFAMDPFVDPILQAIQEKASRGLPEPTSWPALSSSLVQSATGSVRFVLGLAGSAATGVASFLLMILASVYLSQDAYKLRDLLLNGLPPVYRPEVDGLLFKLGTIWNGFLKGQVALMVFTGGLIWLGATVLGLPGALALGVFSGLMELLPGLGATLAIIPAVLIAMTQGSDHLALGNGAFTLVVIGYYIAVQTVENVVAAPRLMSRAVRLHPLVVILGFVVGGLSFGILGALLATPVIASVKEIVSYLTLKIRGLPVDVVVPTPRSAPDSRRRAVALPRQGRGTSTQEEAPEVEE